MYFVFFPYFLLCVRGKLQSAQFVDSDGVLLLLNFAVAQSLRPRCQFFWLLFERGLRRSDVASLAVGVGECVACSLLPKARIDHLPFDRRPHSAWRHVPRLRSHRFPVPNVDAVRFRLSRCQTDLSNLRSRCCHPSADQQAVERHRLLWHLSDRRQTSAGRHVRREFSGCRSAAYIQHR